MVVVVVVVPVVPVRSGHVPRTNRARHSGANGAIDRTRVYGPVKAGTVDRPRPHGPAKAGRPHAAANAAHAVANAAHAVANAAHAVANAAASMTSMTGCHRARAAEAQGRHGRNCDY